MAQFSASSVTEEVIEQIAEREGVDERDLEPPLFDSIDPDALEGLFDNSSPGTEVRVTFAYHGYDVTVAETGVVEVSERE